MENYNYFLIRDSGGWLRVYDVIHGSLEENKGYSINTIATRLQSIPNAIESLSEWGFTPFVLPLGKTLHEDLYSNPFREVLFVSEELITLEMLEREVPEILL